MSILQETVCQVLEPKSPSHDTRTLLIHNAHRKVPKVFWIGVEDEVVKEFDSSDECQWAELFIDQAIEDIFT